MTNLRSLVQKPERLNHVMKAEDDLQGRLLREDNRERRSLLREKVVTALSRDATTVDITQYFRMSVELQVLKSIENTEEILACFSPVV